MKWNSLNEARRCAQAEADRINGPVSLVSVETDWYLEAYIPAHERGTNVIVVRPTTREEEEGL